MVIFLILFFIQEGCDKCIYEALVRLAQEEFILCMEDKIQDRSVVIKIFLGEVHGL